MRVYKYRMSRLRAIPLLLALALAFASCAGPNKLAQQSEEAFRNGETEKAYEKAARSLEKQPGNERGLRAMTAAATRMLDRRMEEIHNLAARDTVAAAWRVLDLEDFHQGLARYNVAMPVNAEFNAEARAIRSGAVDILYRRGRSDLDGGSPKKAYGEFESARRFDPDYKDVVRRLRQAYEEARPKVALFPFANDTDLRGLSIDLADQGFETLRHSVRPPEYRFTEMAERDRVYAVLPVLLLESVGRPEALRLGREIGADRVILGRVHGLRANTDTQTWHETLFHKVVEKDEKGVSAERYVEQHVDIVKRGREVLMRYEYQVLDVADDRIVFTVDDEVAAEAHAIYTSASVSGDCADYCLVPPDLKRADAKRAGHVEDQWRERYGSWTVPELLQRSRAERERTGRKSNYWSEPRHQDSRNRPVFVEDVPSERELALSGLEPLWKRLLSTLRELDATEP